MDLEHRVKSLEQELEILKNQIQATLLDIREQILVLQYPYLRAENGAHLGAGMPAQASARSHGAPDGTGAGSQPGDASGTAIVKQVALGEAHPAPAGDWLPEDESPGAEHMAHTAWEVFQPEPAPGPDGEQDAASQWAAPQVAAPASAPLASSVAESVVSQPAPPTELATLLAIAQSAGRVDLTRRLAELQSYAHSGVIPSDIRDDLLDLLSSFGGGDLDDSWVEDAVGEFVSSSELAPPAPDDGLQSDFYAGETASYAPDEEYPEANKRGMILRMIDGLKHLDSGRGGRHG